MNIFKEIGKFPTKNGLNLEEDHYYDLCLFQEEVYECWLGLWRCLLSIFL